MSDDVVLLERRDDADLVAVSALPELAPLIFLAVPLLEFAILVSNVLTQPLIDLGQGWLGLAFLPVNNPASVLVLSARVALTAWKKFTGASLLR